RLTRVTCGGAPAYIWPGGGITFMVDVTRMPQSAFGYVPTPALVAPIEFTLKLADYAALGGYIENVRPLSSILRSRAGSEPPARDQFVHDAKGPRHITARPDNPWPLAAEK